MDNHEDLKAYEKAKKRVKNEKDFFGHLVTYIVINIAIFFFKQKILMLIDVDVKDKDFLSWWSFGNLATPIFWGIGLFFHWLWAFQKSFIFNKKWEERKTKEFMDKEDY
ncbi:2TM domain-containing protein [Aquimarina algiphila]|uniref:2TM domain-containing protein n=1 Tax=Aquimarina algiphila TaxID=2047982 RepID=UPI00232ADEC8|nr:2TM domain-containing protein [Aquimarina algiphila]